ncbi:MAG: hypothetical protein M1821_005950 [Bathelium mastoideum]|nr:MAG: hypothetical protein M1821_005950 [Bathelium mastoideum]
MYVDRQPLILAVNIFGLFLTVIPVAFRFLVRIRHGSGLWWDDWLAFVAMLLCASISALSIQGLKYGYGLQMNNMTLEDIPPLLKLFYASGLVYQTALGLTKTSILLFYRRIFPTRHVIIGCWVLGVLDATWTIATDAAWAVQCSPIESLWDPLVPGKCMDRPAFILGIGLPNIIIDVGVFVLPVYSVWQLQMPMTRKLAVTGIFGVALFAVLCSILRLAFAYDEFRTDNLYAWVIGLTWSKSRSSSAEAKYRTERAKAKPYDTQAFIELESQGLSKEDMGRFSKGTDNESDYIEAANADEKRPATQNVRSIPEPEKAQTKGGSTAGKAMTRHSAPTPLNRTDGIQVKTSFEVVAEEMV